MIDKTPTAENISLHGLGFIQIKLGGKYRMHIWHPDLPQRECFEHSQIHNHRFGFTSHILVGKQTNINYDIWPATDDEHGTHIGYTHEGPRSQFGNRPWVPDSLRSHIQERSRQTYEPGQFYMMRPGMFHATDPGHFDGKVATLMLKIEETDIPAISLCRAGITPDADFDRKQLSPGALWEYALDVIGHGDFPAAYDNDCYTHKFLVSEIEVTQG